MHYYKIHAFYDDFDDFYVSISLSNTKDAYFGN